MVLCHQKSNLLEKQAGDFISYLITYLIAIVRATMSIWDATRPDDDGSCSFDSPWVQSKSIRTDYNKLA